jgi:hypothetical protein
MVISLLILLIPDWFVDLMLVLVLWFQIISKFLVHHVSLIANHFHQIHLNHHHHWKRLNRVHFYFRMFNQLWFHV